MKVLLVSPPGVATAGTLEYLSVGQPLGIAYLAARLRDEGFDVELLDALMDGFLKGVRPSDLKGNVEPGRVRVSRGVVTRTDLDESFSSGSFVVGMSPETILEYVRRSNPDVLGISVTFTSRYKISLRIAELVKQWKPVIRIVLGGVHVTVSPMKTLNHPAVDYIVTGEGEYSFPSLLKAIGQGADLAGIPGVGFKDAAGRPVLAKPQRIVELDRLPYPAFDLLRMNDYFDAAAEGRVVKMYTSRGCTFNCCFCSVPFTSQRRFYAHSPERVIAEMTRLISEYDMENVLFEDDNMNLNPPRFQRIFELFVARGFRLKLHARNLRCDILPDDALRLMKKAGFEMVWITPESGSQRVLDEIIGKRMDLDEVLASVRRIHTAGLEIGAAFVLGLPGETLDEMVKTIDFARRLKKMGVKSFWFSIATPIEGTRLYTSALNMGLLKEMDVDRFSYNEGTLSTAEWSGEQVSAVRRQAMRELNE